MMTADHASGTDRVTTGTVGGVREMLLLASIALFPMKRDLTLWSVPGGGNDHYQRVGLRAIHLPLAILTVLVAWELLRRRPISIRSNYAKLALGTAAWFLVSFLASPSWRGVDFLLHVAAAAAIWWSVVKASAKARLRILTGLVALGVFESMLGIGQFLRGRTLGLDLVEAAGGFTEFGGRVAIRGSLTYNHHIAGLLLVCTAAGFAASALGCSRRLRSALWLSLVPLGIAVPMTFSRAAVLAVSAMGLVLLLRHWSTLRMAILAWSTGLALGAALTLQGWLQRAEQSARVGSGGHGIDNGRLDLSREALDLVEQAPLIGFGPGNYVPELREQLGVVGEPSIKIPSVHNVVAHAAVEAGVLGGILALALLVALAAWTWQGGSMRTVAVFSLLPYVLLDRFPYSLQVGFVMTGFWLGIAQVAHVAANDDEEPVNQPEPRLASGP